jgi:uncharacterized protein
MRNKERVVVLGASDRSSRYSHMALVSLLRHGHEPVPVHPRLQEIEGIRVVNDIDDVRGRVDTVTLYVGPGRLSSMVDAIVSLQPRRIIANPGAESESMRLAAERHDIEYLEACTLVMLSTGQF